MQTIYMVGHSNHELEVFLSLLTKHEIGFLIDVRSYPRSRLLWFTQYPLKQSLEGRGIKYAHFPSLGGRNPLEGLTLRREVECALDAPELVGLRAAMMCSEGKPDKCHRRYLLEPVILDLGHEVRQILPNGELEAPGARQASLF